MDQTPDQPVATESALSTRLAPDGFASWPAYWQAQGMLWRTEPEIDEQQQAYLEDRRHNPAYQPDIMQGIYPFKGIRLTRADVEWLLATHDIGNMRGPVDWSDPKQRERQGLDLRGGDVRGVNLSNLPLARMRGGLNLEEYSLTDKYGHEAASAHFEGTKFNDAHLEGSALIRAHFEDADLGHAQLQCAVLRSAHLEDAYLGHAQVQGADLRRTYFSEGTILEDLALDGEAGYDAASIGEARWDSTNLAGISWTNVRRLGDEELARRRKTANGQRKDRSTRLKELLAAVRANRKLAALMRAQGLNEDADRFAYRAQALQKYILRRQGHPFRTVFSWFLDLLAGHGYKPGRTLIAYLLAIVSFGTAYYLLGQNVGPPFSLLGSFVFSVTSFHGRGFFPGGIGLDDPITVLAAFEAFVGLVIEVSFIATFTQRFFSR